VSVVCCQVEVSATS